MDRLAEEGNPAKYNFPRSLIDSPGLDFSFSGLKTSVRYFLQKNTRLADDPVELRNLCAGIRAAIVDVLVAKTLAAAVRCRVNCITASGGVTANRALRRNLAAACASDEFKLRVAPMAFCTDNAAMVGLLAERKFREGRVTTDFSSEPLPGWELAKLSL